MPGGESSSLCHKCGSSTKPVHRTKLIPVPGFDRKLIRGTPKSWCFKCWMREPHIYGFGLIDEDIAFDRRVDLREMTGGDIILARKFNKP